ncbi:hypothetical protein BJ508DRAFT_305786 [Ascobolus immersus RN42]|uniref:Uncharacterized protein n=1 Tax=Ascobolus immersus RN42 TaxID=1160509 RepID=A0A3N4I8J7_ASCIM|nr:hypothetical protein BJ508DRAFT_305786 [Ascobolus immersus RN42]
MAHNALGALYESPLNSYLYGFQPVTYRDYHKESQKPGGLSFPFCSNQWHAVNPNYVVSVEHLDPADCGRCLEVCGDNVCAHVMVVDIGGKGLNLSKKVAHLIFEGKEKEHPYAMWRPVQSWYCKDLGLFKTKQELEGPERRRPAEDLTKDTPQTDYSSDSDSDTDSDWGRYRDSDRESDDPDLRALKKSQQDLKNGATKQAIINSGAPKKGVKEKKKKPTIEGLDEYENPYDEMQDAIKGNKASSGDAGKQSSTNGKVSNTDGRKADAIKEKASVATSPKMVKEQKKAKELAREETREELAEARPGKYDQSEDEDDSEDDDESSETSETSEETEDTEDAEEDDDGEDEDDSDDDTDDSDSEGRLRKRSLEVHDPVAFAAKPKYFPNSPSISGLVPVLHKRDESHQEEHGDDDHSESDQSDHEESPGKKAKEIIEKPEKPHMKEEKKESLSAKEVREQGWKTHLEDGPKKKDRTSAKAEFEKDEAHRNPEVAGIGKDSFLTEPKKMPSGPRPKSNRVSNTPSDKNQSKQAERSSHKGSGSGSDSDSGSGSDSDSDSDKGKKGDKSEKDKKKEKKKADPFNDKRESEKKLDGKTVVKESEKPKPHERPTARGKIADASIHVGKPFADDIKQQARDEEEREKFSQAEIDHAEMIRQQKEDEEEEERRRQREEEEQARQEEEKKKIPISRTKMEKAEHKLEAHPHEIEKKEAQYLGKPKETGRGEKVNKAKNYGAPQLTDPEVEHLKGKKDRKKEILGFDSDVKFAEKAIHGQDSEDAHSRGRKEKRDLVKRGRESTLSRNRRATSTKSSRDQKETKAAESKNSENNSEDSDSEKSLGKNSKEKSASKKNGNQRSSTKKNNENQRASATKKNDNKRASSTRKSEPASTQKSSSKDTEKKDEKKATTSQKSSSKDDEKDNEKETDKKETTKVQAKKEKADGKKKQVVQIEKKIEKEESSGFDSDSESKTSKGDDKKEADKSTSNDEEEKKETTKVQAKKQKAEVKKKQAVQVEKGYSSGSESDSESESDKKATSSKNNSAKSTASKSADKKDAESVEPAAPKKASVKSKAKGGKSKDNTSTVPLEITKAADVTVNKEKNTYQSEDAKKRSDAAKKLAEKNAPKVEVKKVEEKEEKTEEKVEIQEHSESESSDSDSEEQREVIQDTKEVRVSNEIKEIKQEDKQEKKITDVVASKAKGGADQARKVISEDKEKSGSKKKAVPVAIVAPKKSTNLREEKKKQFETLKANIEEKIAEKEDSSSERSDRESDSEDEIEVPGKKAVSTSPARDDKLQKKVVEKTTDKKKISISFADEESDSDSESDWEEEEEQQQEKEEVKKKPEPVQPVKAKVQPKVQSKTQAEKKGKQQLEGKKALAEEAKSKKESKDLKSKYKAVESEDEGSASDSDYDSDDETAFRSRIVKRGETVRLHKRGSPKEESTETPKVSLINSNDDPNNDGFKEYSFKVSSDESMVYNEGSPAPLSGKNSRLDKRPLRDRLKNFTIEPMRLRKRGNSRDESLTYTHLEDNGENQKHYSPPNKAVVSSEAFNQNTVADEGLDFPVQWPKSIKDKARSMKNWAKKFDGMYNSPGTAGWTESSNGEAYSAGRVVKDGEEAVWEKATFPLPGQEEEGGEQNDEHGDSGYEEHEQQAPHTTRRQANYEQDDTKGRSFMGSDERSY